MLRVGLIKTNKADILAILVQHVEMLIGPAIFREAVTAGKARGYPDAAALEQIIHRFVQQKRPQGHPRTAQMVQSVTVGAGEREALDLYLGEHADAVMSDDRGFLALLSAHRIPYVTPAAVLVALCDWDILTVQDATHALELLRPLIRAEQYHAARTDLAVLERK